MLTTLISFAFVLGVLVFVHELGHFLAAKRVGIRVLKFQLGFNPTIFSFKYGDTEYGIGALPLGGYVKMAGESAEEERTGHPDEFLSKSKWQRFQVLIMGPVMNLLLAVVVLAVVLYQGADYPIYDIQPPIVGSVQSGSAAEKAGIQRGDRFTSVAGSRVETWKDFLIAVSTRTNHETAIGFVRDGTDMTKTVTPTPEVGSRFEIGSIGVLPDVHPRVWPTINKGEPGDRAGIKVGDVIVAADGKTITFREELIEVIAKHAGTPMTLTIEREEGRRDITVTPEKRGDKGVLGIYLADATRSVRPGAFEAVAMSVRENIEGAGLIFKTVWGLVTRQASPKQLLGPVGIAQLSGEFFRVGWIALLGLMANLSLNLGLVNLLPIPVLDGGHIFIMALEGVARRDFSMRVKEKMLLAGFVVLMMLMVTVIYNDLTRISWIEHLMPWRN